MVEKVYVPVDWVNEDVEAILRMIVMLGDEESILITHDAVNPETQREALNFLSVWVLGDAYQVFVQTLGSFQILGDIIFILADATSNGNMLEQFENELFLVLVWVDHILSIGILIVFPKHDLSEFIAQNNAFMSLLIIHSDCAIFSTDPILVEDVEKWHVQNVAVHFGVLDACALSFTHTAEWCEIGDYLSRVEKVFQEVIGTNQVEGAIETEFCDFDSIFITPFEKSILSFRALEIREHFWISQWHGIELVALSQLFGFVLSLRWWKFLFHFSGYFCLFDLHDFFFFEFKFRF